MTVNKRARTKDEFIYLIKQALDKIFFLRAAIQYGQELMGVAGVIVEPFKRGLSHPLNSVKSDHYRPGKGNFLHVLKNTDQRAIPFWPVVRLTQNTHTNGYQGA